MIQRCLAPGLIILIAVVFSAKPAAATDKDVLVRLGDSAYSRKAYDSAAYYYSQAAIGTPDAVVLYKLGNTHFRLKHTGQAVLAYKRALKHRPGFADAAENLDFIQRRIQPDTKQDDVFLIRWWHAFTKPSLSNVWAVLGIVCFGFPIVILSWRRFSGKQFAWLQPQLIAGGIVLGILFAMLATGSAGISSGNTAVIMSRDAVLNTANKDKGSGKPGATALPEGLVVRVLRREGGVLLVSLPDGREGLMQPSDIALVE